MPNEKAAGRLDIGHENLPLHYDPHASLWRNPNNSAWERVESAALGHFINLGWSGYAGEGGLVLNLIKEPCRSGTEEVSRIAALFARDPYKYRKGWPALTLWKGADVAFREIKAPGDRLRGSQVTVIRDVLKPLGLDVSVVDAVPS